MKPAWEQLEKAFENSKTAIIVDVDCTSDKSKDLCSKYGVRGYPTIKYITGDTDPLGDSYDGGRDFDALKAFADEVSGVRAKLVLRLAPTSPPRGATDARSVLHLLTRHHHHRTLARPADPATSTSAPTSRRRPSLRTRPRTSPS